jgi:hypothetical protein
MIGVTSGQFYYGFVFAHFGFFPNYFSALIPPNYMEGFTDDLNPYGSNVPNSYRLLTGDANFIRNAGFSLSLLITFLLVYFLVIGVILFLKKYYGFYEIWYKRIAFSAFIGGI